LSTQCLRNWTASAKIANDTLAENEVKHRMLTADDKKAACCMMSAFSDDGVPRPGAFTRVGAMFSVGGDAMGRLWKQIRAKLQNQINPGNDGDDDNNRLPIEFFATKSRWQTRREAQA